MAKKKKKGLQVVGNIDFKDDKNGLKVVGKVDFDDNNNITNKTAFIQQQDIAPVKQTGFFNNAKGSTLQKIGNTAVDATGNILKGGLSAFEGIADFGRYRGADVLDLFGADKKAKKVRETAKANTTEEIFSSIDHILSGDLAGKVNENDLAAFKDIKEGSYLGDKGSQVFQGVGNSATNAALSALGGNVGGMTSLFMSASGNAQSEAYQEGATDFQAGIYGALSGSVETATEMMFGGLGKITQNLGFGTGALDDQLINRFTRKLSNTIAKNAVDLGLRSAGEGVEEVVAGFGNAILQKLTYMKDEDFSKLLKDQKLMDSFVSGALSSALMQSPTTLSATMQGRESSTGYTENEREVYNRELENRLKAEEKLTKRRRTQIEEQLNQDFERGYVNAQNIRDILGDKIDLQKDTRLAESFNEETRRTQAYENDVSKYDEKQRKVIQTAIDSGLLNNSNKTHDMVDLIAKLSADKGVDFDFTNNERIKDSGFAIDGRQVNGFVKDGTVNLNLESNQVLNKTVGHEITHVLEGTELYDNLQQSLKAYIGEKEWNNRISQLEKVYKDVKGANIENELTSDLVGEHIFNDENFIRNLSTKNPNLFQKIFDEIKYMVKIATAGSKEARDLEKVKRAFEKAYRETSKTQEGTQYSVSEEDLEKYVYPEQVYEAYKNEDKSKITQTIDELEEYKKTLDTETDEGWSENFNTNAKIKALENGYESVYDYYVGEEKKRLRKEIEGEYGRGYRALQEGIQNEKKNNQLQQDIAESTDFKNAQFQVIQNSNPMFDDYHVGIRSPKDIKTFSQAIEDEESFAWGDYTKEDAERDLARDRVTIYSSYPIKQGVFVSTSRIQAEQYAGGEGNQVYSKTVRPEKVAWISGDEGQYASVRNKFTEDIKYSLSVQEANTGTDSEGRQLSQGQQEYFKDSKATDENGNLLVLYHGTPNGDFNIFDRNKLGETTLSTDSKLGFHFTENKEFAELYSNGKIGIDRDNFDSTIKKVYLNIEKPFDLRILGDYIENGRVLTQNDIKFIKDFAKIYSDEKLNTIEDIEDYFDDFYDFDTDRIKDALDINKLKKMGYDGVINYIQSNDMGVLQEEEIGNYGYEYIAFESNQIKNVDNLNPTDNPDIRYQLGNNEVAPTSGWNVRSEDVRLQSAFKDAIAPIQEQVQQLTDTMNRLEERIAPVEETAEKSQYPMIDKINDFLWKLQGKKDKYYGLLKPDFITEIANEERQQRIDAVNNLIDNLSKKITDSNNELNINDVKDQLTTEINNYIDEYRPLTEQEGEQLAEEYANRDISKEIAPVNENLTEKENQRLAVLDLLERNNMLDEEHQYERDQLLEKANPTIPNEEATPGKALEDIRDENEVGKRSVKAYQYEHPEVKPYFQQEARGMLSDLEMSQKGERFMFESPKQGQGTNWEVLGIKRFTSPEIADLLDSKWGYTYKDIEKGLKAIIEDHGAENIAVAKRIEFILDDNLRNGYTDWQTGMKIPPNQDYLNMLAEQEWNEYYDNIQEQYPLEPYTPVEENVPDYYSIEDEDVSDMKIDKDLQDMTVDDINLEPFLEGLQKASDRQAERQQLREELNQKKEVKIPRNPELNKAKNKASSLFVNEFAAVDDFGKRHGNNNIKFKADTYNNYQAIAQSNIETAQTDINGKAIGRSGQSIFDEAKRLNLSDEFDTYLKQWANVDRAKQGKGANYTASESYKIVKEMEAKNPELKRLGKDMWQYYRNARHNLRDAGIINQQTSDLLGRMYPHYTPYISENIENYFVKDGELKPKQTIKRAKGGAIIEGLLSTEEAMQRYTKSEFNTIFGNDLYREIVNTSNDIVRQGNDDRGMQFVNADNLYADKDGYYLTAYENGEPVTAKISEEMYDTLTRETKNRIADIENTFGAVTKPLQKLSNIRRNILTSWSPTFIAKNFIKDFQEGIFNSKYTGDFIKNYPSAFKELASNTELAQQFKSLYGSGLTMGQYEIDANNYTPKGKNKGFLQGIKNANELIELAPRYAEFKASIDHGASIQEAMYNAREVTTNFSRGGTLAKALNRNGFTFLNSSIQGFDKFIRNFSGENGAKGVVNSLAKAVIFGIAPAVFNELAFGTGDDKDEEYEAIPDYIKDNYYIIKTGDGNFVRIPKGRVFSVFGSAARRTIEMMEGEENAFDGFLENTQQQIGINNPEENNIFAPFIQAMGGRKLDSGQTAGKAWYGGDIIPSRLQKERPEDQYDASIDKLSIWLGQQTGISPYKINYVLDQYSGGIGDLFLPMITDEANSDGSIIAPIKDQFTADSTTDNKYVSEFYDTKGKLYTGSKATDEDILKNKYMNSISSEMAKLYAERREVQASDLPKKEKYAKSQEIKKEINRLAKIGLDGYNNLEVTGNYAVINDDMGYYKNANGEWKPIPQNDITYTESEGLTDNEKSAYYGLKNDIYNINKEYEDESLNASTEEKRILNAQKKNEIIDTIKSSNLDDNTKAYIYSKKYGDKKIQSFINSGIDVNSYLDYKQQDFSADKDRNGKSISGSKKRKVFDYINSMNIPYEQKLILAKSEYNSFNQNNYDIINYIENSGMSYDERIELYKNLGFKVDGDSISW